MARSFSDIVITVVSVKHLAGDFRVETQITAFWYNYYSFLKINGAQTMIGHSLMIYFE